MYLKLYPTWLVAISVSFLVLERLWGWRSQALFRDGWARDFLFLVFNGHVFSLLAAPLNVWVGRQVGALLPVFPWQGFVSRWGFVPQVLTLLIVWDFIQYGVHNLLHRVPFLWTFHKVHHSITIMDFVGNFRFHWVEILVYRSALAIPLAYLGASNDALLAIAVISTFWGDFNHSNINLALGPLSYLFNTPRMHLWHHDQSTEGGVAKNFGITLSVWDFLFRTAYWPRDRQPAQLGYPAMDDMPSGFLGQIFWPVVRRETSGSSR